MAILFCKTSKEFKAKFEEAKTVVSLLSQADQAIKQGDTNTPTHEQILARDETPDWIKIALDISFAMNDCEGIDVDTPLILLGKGVTKRM